CGSVFHHTAPTDIYTLSLHDALPISGFGKIEVGQQARIKLNNYPSYEFGHLEGVVSKLTEIPNENSYQVEITLDKGMTSSYNKRSEEHTSELQSRENLVCRLLLEKKK